MEDQQPDPGDVTDETSGDQSGADAAVEPMEEPPAEEADADVRVDLEDPGNQAAETGVDDLEHAAPARRSVAKWVAVAVAGAAAALFVGSAAFAGAAMRPYLADRVMVDTKLEVARTAANAISTLWNYTPDDMDTLADRAATYLSGDFEAQYRKFVDAIAAPNKQAQITDHTEVTGVAVESLNDSEAVAIVYTNTTATSPLSKDIPSLKYLSYRLMMKREQSRWMVTKMTTITSLDLTPQL